MVIGRRLYQRRQDLELSQTEIEARTGLLQCYISRVEHGHIVPSLENLERLAQALEIPLFRLFFDESEPPSSPHAALRPAPEDLFNDPNSGGYEPFFRMMEKVVSRLSERDRGLFLHMARKLARRQRQSDADMPGNSVTTETGSPLEEVRFEAGERAGVRR